MRNRTLSPLGFSVLLALLPAFSCKHAGPQATRAAGAGPAMPLEAAPPPLTGHNLVYNGDFARGARSLPWNGELSKPAAGRTFVDKGELCMEVKNRGPNRWDAQLRHQHIKLEKGHTYTVQFKMRSSQPTRVYLKLGQAGPPFKEFWKLLFPISDKQQVYSGTFTMQAPDDPSVEMAFHLGGQLSRLTPVPFTVCLDDVRVDDPQYVEKPEPVPPPVPGILVNQVGYAPALAKIAIVKRPDAVGWQLVNDKGEVVANGTTIPFGADAASGDQVSIADFTAYAGEGTGYTLKVGNDVSHPFDIRDDIYSQAQVRRARVLLPAAQRHRDRDAVRGRSEVGAPGGPHRRQAQLRRQQRAVRGGQRLQLLARRQRRLVRRRRPRQVRGQRRHLGVDAAQLLGARAGVRQRAPTSPTASSTSPRTRTRSPTCSTRRAGSWSSSSRCRCPRGRSWPGWRTTRSTTRSGRSCRWGRTKIRCRASCSRRARRRR